MDAIDLTFSEVDKLKRNLNRSKSVQVRSQEERSLVKATALAWINSHRSAFSGPEMGDTITKLDSLFADLITGSDRATSRKKYNSLLKQIRSELLILRNKSALHAAASTPAVTTDGAPAFSPLISDPKMQSILDGRWSECVACISAGAPLSAIVMMGGLLEALLLSRINRETNKGAIFQSKAAPKDAAGTTKALKEWTLNNYLDVCHDLGWITVSAKDVGQVLRDYRNYIHPFKQFSHGVVLSKNDAQLLWEISKAVARQIINGVLP